MGSARERASRADREARLRLSRDPYHLIREARGPEDGRPRNGRAVHQLSDAELDVLRCASRGMTQKMTADYLGKSVETVKGQRKTAIAKMTPAPGHPRSAKDITSACCEAIRRGLIA